MNKKIKLPPDQVFMDFEGANEFVSQHGIPMVHYRSLPDPAGKVLRDDVRRPKLQDSYSTDGFIYRMAGKVDVQISSNRREDRHVDLGYINSASLHATIPSYYRGTQSFVYILPRDRFYLDDPSIVVPTMETVESVANGLDRTRFPIQQVQDLIDANGVSYGFSDFDIVDGRIQWKGLRPPFDLVENRGSLFVIRYLYRPYWYVEDFVHELRLQPVFLSDEKVVKRFPQQVILNREYVFQNKRNNEDAAPYDARQVMAPRDGSFGPR